MKTTRTLASTVTPNGQTIALQEHDSQFYMRINGTTLMSTTAFASEQEMAVIACQKIVAAREKPARVLIGGLGFGYTLSRVLELVSDTARVDVAELLPDIVEWNRRHLRNVNGSSLDDARVTIHQKDVFDLIKSPAKTLYDAILLDVDNSPDPLVQSGNARLYSTNGLLAVQRALDPGGRVVFWSGNSDRDFGNELREVFTRTESIPARAYPGAKRCTHTLFVADC